MILAKCRFGEGMKEDEIGGTCSMCHWLDLGIDGRVILRWILKKEGATVWPGFTCLRISGGALWTGRQYPLSLHTRRGISRLTAILRASHENYTT
jgi:hypothetical protein